MAATATATAVPARAVAVGAATAAKFVSVGKYTRIIYVLVGTALRHAPRVELPARPPRVKLPSVPAESVSESPKTPKIIEVVGKP